MSAPGSTVVRGLGTVAAAAALGLGYSLIEARSYRLRRVDIAVLPAGQRPLRVLHISDLHLTAHQSQKVNWVKRLTALKPDLVVTTGDNLAGMDAVPSLLDAYSGLLNLPGVFVLGSNDYYAPTLKNPARYFSDPERKRRIHGQELPWGEMVSAFTAAGWIDLSNRRAELNVDGRHLAFVGVDDPHLGRDRYPAGPAPTDVDLAMGIMHAPYLRVIDAMNYDGYPVLLAGHTHGGQLCVPGYGALVTNCDLDTRRAKGLSVHRAPSSPSESWLHVSAGLGTSPFTPVRFACPPEATLVTLTASPDGRSEALVTAGG